MKIGIVQRSRLKNRIRSVSRDSRNKFAQEAFCTVNIDNLEYDKIRNILPLSTGNSEFSSLNEGNQTFYGK